MSELQTVYLSLGSNLDERQENLEQALRALEGNPIRVVRRSSLYETEPQDYPDQAWFLNAVLEVQTHLPPRQLLETLQAIERSLGRVRGAGAVPKGPRSIDIDILLYGDFLMDATALTIPHARLLERRFVLEPLAEIAPELRHPQTKELLRDRLPFLTGQKIRRYSG